MIWITSLLRRPPISWWDLLDILVVWILIYEILKLIRGTRAVQMALGGGLLVSLFYGSQWGHLETVNWLVRNMVGYIVFAAIVLFQSDIRRALAHFGRAPFFRYFAKTESAEESIEEIIVAAGLLSSQRIGAIIAIERQIGLRNYIEGGIPLDATVTYDLLQSIFLPASPLHDGAVIVQNDRVAAAACFLPLTINPKLGKELGSRHRAAIGLTGQFAAVDGLLTGMENLTLMADLQHLGRVEGRRRAHELLESVGLLDKAGEVSGFRAYPSGKSLRSCQSAFTLGRFFRYRDFRSARGGTGCEHRRCASRGIQVESKG
jgi:uncharacterized protein (TIGR00159 family)